MLNQFGDSVARYTVELGRQNDTRPRITCEIEAKCDYMAAEIAERITPGYIAFTVYRTEKGQA